MQGFKLLGLFFTLLLCLGCSREGPQAPLLPDQVPSFSVTRAFGDPPVEGQVVLSPTTPSLAWNFELDLDHDGAAEHAGRLEEAVRFDYSFSKSGVHPILISFISPTAEFSDTLFVVVNGSLSAVVMARNDQATGGSPGIIFADSFLYATTKNRVEQYDANTLELTDVAVFENPSIPKGFLGLGVSPSGYLYVANRRPEEILRLLIPQLELDRVFPVPRQTGAYQVFPTSDDHVVAGGGQKISLLDSTMGTILAERTLLGSSYIAASNNGRYVATAISGENSTIRMLDGRSLDDLWQLKIGSIDEYIIGFSLDSEVVYWLGQDFDRQLRFFAIDAASGRVLRNIILAEYEEGFHFFRVLASGFSQNDAYTFMMTDDSAYVIDHTFHLPIASIGLPEIFLCCSVAASDAAVYFGLSDGTLLRVTLTSNR